MPVVRTHVWWWFGAMFLLTLAALLLAMGHGAAQETHDVEVGDLFFEPQVVEVQAGDTVRWSYLGGFEPHDIVAVNGLFNSHPNCDQGSGSCMAAGNTFEWTFTQPGEVAYYCTLHGTASGLGMAGTVIVHQAEPDTGSIQGTVTDAGTGAPIAGASVTAGGASTTTGADGSYAIEELDAGEYSVAASADGYEPASQAATVTAGQITVLDLALDAEPVGAGPVVTMVWNNHFETVTDGVFVQWDQPISEQFPEDGPGPAGYTLHAAADCSDQAIAQGVEGFAGRPGLRDLIMDDGWDAVTYGDTYYLGAAPGTEFGTDSLAPSQQACFEFVAQLSIDHQSTFAGQVTDAGSGAPIAGATVTVTRTIGAPETVAGTATSEGDGTYVVDHLAPGPYELTVEADGYQTMTQEASALRTQTVVVDFGLQPDEVDPPPGGLACGAEVTANVTLTQDLGPCPGHGLIIAANNVTVNLGGFSIIGDPAERPNGTLVVGSRDRAGVLFRQVTGSMVMSGTVRDFDAGVAIMGGGGNTAHFMTLVDNINYRVTTGADADPGSATPDCLFGEGLVIFNSSGNTVEDNSLTNNGPISGMAVVGNSDNNTLQRNAIVDSDVVNRTRDGDPRNTICGTGAEQGPMTRGRQVMDIGVRIEGPGAQNNTVADNTVTRSSIAGIGIHGFVCATNPAGAPIAENNGGNQIVGNTVTRTGERTVELDGLADGIATLATGPAAIVCVSHSNTLSGNTATGNARDGINLGGRGSHSNVVNDNVVDDNARNGIAVAGPGGGVPGAINNTLHNNSGHDNGVFDGADFNADCDNNDWQNSDFGTVNQECVNGDQPDLELVPAGSGTLHGREIVEEQAFLGLPCPWDVSRTVYRVRGIGTYEGVDAAGDRVVYEATIDEGQTLHQDGPLRVDVESTVPYRHGPNGTFAHEDATCQNPGYQVSANFEIFADGHVHDGGGQPCLGEGFFARVANGVWHAEWTLLTDCVVEGDEGGSGLAPAGSTHTMDGVHVPGTGADVGRNIRVDYEQFLLLPADGGPDTGAIGGTVTDASTGDPIEGATVTANDLTTTTAADGSYLIDDLEAGEYAVTARASDYLFTSTRMRTVAAGETTTVDFALKPAVPVTVGPTVGLAVVAEGLTAPVQVLSAPDGSGRLFIVDQIGLIRVVSADGELLSEPFLDLRDRLVAFRPGFDERGALGLAFHPDYAANGRLFVYYSAPLRPGGPEGWNHTSHISEFSVSTDPDVVDHGSERVVLQVDQPQFNHNGGQVVFGPDGYLYISLGDGGGSNDTAMGHTPEIGNAQDVTNLLGSILRIDVDGAQPYAIPPGNPFVGAEGRDEIFAYGLRNPYRISFDQGGDHALLAGDAGQGLWEEVSLVTAGGNYGWNIKEGTHCFNPVANLQMPEGCPDVGPRGEPLIDPVIEYPHIRQPGGIGVVVVGGYVYRGSDVPSLQGRYIFGDWSTSFGAPDGTLLVADPQASGLWPIHEVAVKDRPDGRLGHYVLGFGQDDAGEVYVLTSDSVSPQGDTGKVYRITADTDTGDITGTVADADSGDPIAGATVTADGQSATTAADGTYQIDGIAAGDHTVTAEADGYESASQSVTVAARQTATADFALEPLVVEPDPGAIAGTVTDAASGAPIAGATVTAAGQSATTAADGTYMLHDVDAGTYTVTASAAGYVSASQSATVADGATTTVNVALAAEVVVGPTDPTSKTDCMGNGWQTYGFKNQGQCIRYVQTGQDSR